MNFSVKTDILSYTDVEKENFPKGWKKCTLDEIAYINDVNHKMPKSVERGIPFVSPKDFTENGINFNNVKQISKKDFEILSKKVKPCKGDILFSRIGTIGKARLAPNKEFGISYSLAVVRSRTSDIFNKYLLYLMGSHSVYLQSHKKKNGIGVPDLGLNEIRNFIIPLPPLREQKRIVAKIESIFTQIDAAQKRLEILASQVKSSSASLNALKNSVLKQAFEGKLVPQDSNDESAEVLLKKMHKDSKEALVFEKENLPIGWVKTRVELVCDLVGGGTPSRKNLEYFKDGTIIWLTPTEINKEKILKINTSKEKITELGLSKSSAKLIPQNAVLLTSRASIGYVAIAGTEVTTNQGFASFLCSKIINNYFLAYWLKGNKQILEAKATGTIFKEISKSAIKKLYVDIPPHPEQKRIVSKIESIFDRIDAIPTTHKITHKIATVILAYLYA